MWRALSHRQHLTGLTAAESVNMAKVFRRPRVAGICRAPVPAHRRRVARRHHALPLFEATPDAEHKFRQPDLGALGVPFRGLLVLLPPVVYTCLRMHSVHVPLPRRLLQKHHALLRPGLAPDNKAGGHQLITSTLRGLVSGWKL